MSHPTLVIAFRISLRILFYIIRKVTLNYAFPKANRQIILTTKSRKEGHGIGLQNVKLVVEKYHGQMEPQHTEKSFQVKILLYMKLDEK